MNRSLQLVFPLLLSCFSFAGIAKALPDMTSDDAVSWFGRNPSVTPLRVTKKYEQGYSDFDSSTKAEDGSFSLTVFLNTQGNVETETIDYRPKCYTYYGCSGTVRFEKADRSGGRNLIRTVWGQDVLDDFQTSILMETFSDGSTKRWYQGRIYNYETWHYSDNTIVHFTVVSKKSDQGKRIKQYTFCAKNIRACGP